MSTTLCFSRQQPWRQNIYNISARAFAFPYNSIFRPIHWLNCYKFAEFHTGQILGLSAQMIHLLYIGFIVNQLLSLSLLARQVAAHPTFVGSPRFRHSLPNEGTILLMQFELTFCEYIPYILKNYIVFNPIDVRYPPLVLCTFLAQELVKWELN